MDQKTFAKLGGQATKKKYGTDHYRKIGLMGGNKIKNKYGPDYYKDIKKGISPNEIDQNKTTT